MDGRSSRADERFEGEDILAEKPLDPRRSLRPATEISGVILAGGASRRLPGADKLSLDVGGAKLLERVYGVLRDFCPEITVVGDGGPELSGTRRVPDSRPGGQGPLSGLETGLRASTNDVVFAAAGDMPFLCRELAVRLCEIAENGDLLAAVPVYGERAHPLCAAYRRGIEAEVSAALDGGERSMKGFLASLGRVEYVEDGLEAFGDPDVFLMNVNSPEDLERARNLV